MKFYKSEEVFEVLEAAHLSRQNVVLYGPGGYGKSEMTAQFLRNIGARDHQVTIKALSAGTSIDDLFGGVNMKVLQDTGEIIYNVEKSIFSTPYLVLEEAFDAPVRVLESMKDVLTSKRIRNGAQSFEIKTKFIIVCTNRSKEELSEDNSSKALMERFPLSLKVHWDSHTVEDYMEMLKGVFGELPAEIESLLKYVVKLCTDAQIDPPAPRTVVRLVTVFKTAGIRACRFMDGIYGIDKAIESVIAEQAKIRLIAQQNRDHDLLLERRKGLSLDMPYSEIQAYNKAVQSFHTKYNNDSLTKSLQWG